MFFHPKGEVWWAWEGSGKVAEVELSCVSPPCQESHKAPFFPLTPASPQRRLLFPIWFFIQLQVEGHWDLFDTVLILLLMCDRNEAPQAEVSRGSLKNCQWWLCRAESSREESECSVKYVLPKTPDDPFPAAWTDRQLLEVVERFEKEKGGQMGLS